MKNSVEKKRVTLDELALMVKNGFDNTATKDDLKKFVTKDDIQKFVTKDDIKKLATKKDMKNEGAATRDYTDKRIRELEGKVNTVVNVLREKKVFNTGDMTRIRRADIFPDHTLTQEFHS